MGSAYTDQNVTSVNEHATPDGVVYFFSFDFSKLLTLSSRNTNNICFVVNIYHIQRIKRFFESKRQRVIINSMKRNLLKILFLSV